MPLPALHSLRPEPMERRDFTFEADEWHLFPCGAQRFCRCGLADAFMAHGHGGAGRGRGDGDGGGAADDGLGGWPADGGRTQPRIRQKLCGHGEAGGVAVHPAHAQQPFHHAGDGGGLRRAGGIAAGDACNSRTEDRVALRGKIDRIDRYEGDHGVYLRVVDYKSSQKKLEPVRMWYGLRFQRLAVPEGSDGGGRRESGGGLVFHRERPHVRRGSRT